MGEPFKGYGPSSAALNDALAAAVHDLVPAVLRELRREGQEWKGRGNDGCLWAVKPGGGQPKFLNTATLRGTDPLGFVQEAHFNGDRAAGYRWAVAWLGLDPNQRTAPQPGAAAPDHPGPAPRPDKAEHRRRQALAIYLSGTPYPGTPVADYLAGRIGRDALPVREGLRFLADCYCGEARRGLPAMLAPVIDPTTRQFLAVHRTWLARGADGRWRKAELATPKKVLGLYRGGVIPLARGKSGLELRRAPDDDECLVGEGIENTLAAAWLRPELRAFAAIAVGNLPAIAWPPQMVSVCLVEDRDGENEGPRRARQAATDRWLEEGRGVETMRPPEGFGDMTDWVWHCIRGVAA